MDPASETFSDPSRSPSRGLAPSIGTPDREAWLVLAPTEPEAQRLQQGGLRVRRIGLGPVTAAARTAYLVGQTRPRGVLLLGCAGSYDETLLAPGLATTFGQFSLHGIGVGTGGDHRSIKDLGWNAWTASEQHDPWPATVSGMDDAHHLLTVCAASADPSEAKALRARYPGAVAEDMEAYAVAAVCRELEVPFHCLRGISNLAGHRDPAHWQLASCLDALVELVRERFPKLAPPA